MKYYFAVEETPENEPENKRYIIVARNKENAQNFIKNLSYIYELKEDTFDTEGVLMIR